MTYLHPRDTAKHVAGNLTPHGNRRQLPLLPCDRHRSKPLKTRDSRDFRRIGTATAYGKGNRNLTAFKIEGLDVRRVISCH